MHRTQLQRGEGKAGCIFWVLVLIVTGTIAAQVIPVKIATMQLEDYMKDLAMTQPRRPQNFFEREISNRARELGLEVPKDQVQVKKFPERVVMDVQFTVPIDLFVYEHIWNVKIHVDRDIFLF